jgi:hypothetical protein
MKLFGKSNGTPSDRVGEQVDFTPEGRNKVEILKLHAELGELKSNIRRWLTSLGGLLGVVTAAVSIIVTSNQLSTASKRTDSEKQQLAAERTKFEADKAEERKQKAEEAEASTKGRIAKAEGDLKTKAGELQGRTQELKVVEQKLVEAKKQTDEQFASRATLEQQSADLRAQNEALQKKLVAAGDQLKESGENAAAADITKTVQQNQVVTAKLDLQRVQIEFQAPADAARSDTIKRVAEKVSSQGYSFLRTNIVNRIPDGTEVRYYHDADEKLAQTITDLLQKDFKISPIRASRVNDPDPPDKFIQVAFARSAFTQGPAPTPQPNANWAVQIGFGADYSTRYLDHVQTRRANIHNTRSGRGLPLGIVHQGNDYFLVAGRYPDRESAEKLLDQFRDETNELGLAVKGTNRFGFNPLSPPLRVIDAKGKFGDIKY